MIPFDVSTFKDPGRTTTIYTLDIETTSLFKFPDGSWKCFDYSKPSEFYRGIEKMALPYIWMFGVDDKVYYGRDFSQLETVFKILSGEKKKIIWIHNSGFEFQFLRDIWDSYTITHMIARTIRKPISYEVEELNLQIRCTYMLTNLSLEKAAERYTDIRKRSGDLDYNKIRTPITEMTEQELGYCEYDILTLYEIVRYFRKQYKQLRWIPYTQTGEVRKAFRKTVKYGYVRRIAKQTPDDLMYLIMQKSFQGGITHPNSLYCKKTIEGVPTYDITSSFPTIMMLPMFPQGKFRKIKPEIADGLKRSRWCIIYHVKFHDIKAAKLNKYILTSKCSSKEAAYSDNGRLIRAKMVEMYLTEVDYDIIKNDAYIIGEIEILEAWSAVKGYLPKELIRFMLQLYNYKTKLKGVAGQEDFYMKQKQMLNSLYGCCVTNILKAGCTYEDGNWRLPELSIEYVHEKLEERRNSKSNCFSYPWGLWITAGARARLWEVISKFDKDVVYYDTDSIKYRDNVKIDEYMNEANKEIAAKLARSCEELEIDPELVAPVDKKGIPHPLGAWERDVYAVKFRTLGAKRYAYETRDGSLHTVVSGVNKKKGYRALKGDIENFTDHLVFDYDSAGKLISCYCDGQPEDEVIDYQGNRWKNVQRHGICLQPTTYSMDVSEAYACYIEELQYGFKGGEWIS